MISRVLKLKIGSRIELWTSKINKQYIFKLPTRERRK